MIPEADILDGQLVPPQVFASQALFGGEFLVFDGIQAIGQAGVLDVLLQVGLFQDDFVGRYFKFLDQGRIDPRSDNQHGQKDRHAHCRDPPVPAESESQNRKAAENGGHHQNL